MTWIWSNNDVLPLAVLFHHSIAKPGDIWPREIIWHLSAETNRGCTGPGGLGILLFLFKLIKGEEQMFIFQVLLNQIL